MTITLGVPDSQSLVTGTSGTRMGQHPGVASHLLVAARHRHRMFQRLQVGSNTDHVPTNLVIGPKPA